MRSAAAAHADLSAISTAIVDLDGVPAAHFETDHPCATGVAIDHSFRSRTRFGTLRASSLTYDVRTFRSLKTAASLFPTVAPNDVVARGSRRNSLVRRKRSWIARERMSQNPPAEACQSTIPLWHAPRDDRLVARTRRLPVDAFRCRRGGFLMWEWPDRPPVQFGLTVIRGGTTQFLLLQDGWGGGRRSPVAWETRPGAGRCRGIIST